MIKETTIGRYKKEYEKKEINKVRRRMLNKVPLVDLVTDIDTNLECEFNINIKTHNVIDQQNSGRCWSFAGLNILREKVIENCNLDNFELSGSYIAFYDKLERFNILLERMISYKKENKDIYDRYVESLLENGMTDGGFFTQFANLIQKYGIVPKNRFPESFASSNTYEVNQILSRLLRKFYLELQNNSQEEKLKDKYLKECFTIIANVYGIPPESFDFEYTDKNGEYHIDKNITPKEFYDKYIGINLEEDYAEITSFVDDNYQYNHVYEAEESSRVSGKSNVIALNLSFKEMKNLMLKQLKKGESIYFYCSTTSKRIDGLWLDLMERYGDIFDMDLTMGHDDILKTNGITNAHCMLITGANEIDNKITKWKIENSWGSKCGKQGYYVATDDWINRYVYRVVINKKYMTKKQLELLNQKPIFLKKWEVKS